jgi:tetratricopeptide (TPR) repeat protein
MIRELVFLHAYGGASGRKASVAAALGRLKPHMGDDPWFLGAYSLALSEIGEVDLATRLANAAIDARPDHGVAAHALAHIHFESGDNSGARDFLGEWLTSHGHTAVNAGHVAWHLALVELALSDPDSALRSYREQRTSSGVPGFRLEDAVSLLWRLHMRGVDVSDEWADIALELPPASPSRAFQLAHIAFAVAALGDEDGLRNLAEQVEPAIREAPQEPLRFLPPLLEALRFVAADRWSEAGPAFAAATAAARRLGGSNEQHVLFEEAVAYARTRSGPVTAAP